MLLFLFFSRFWFIQYLTIFYFTLLLSSGKMKTLNRWLMLMQLYWNGCESITTSKRKAMLSTSWRKWMLWILLLLYIKKCVSWPGNIIQNHVYLIGHLQVAICPWFKMSLGARWYDLHGNTVTTHVHLNGCARGPGCSKAD